MTSQKGVLFHLEQLHFDAYGRVCIGDRDAAGNLAALLAAGADAIACRSGCGAPLSCDTALITRNEFVQCGPDLLVNNADFAAIVRKRKAIGATEAVVVFTTYQEMDTETAA